MEKVESEVWKWMINFLFEMQKQEISLFLLKATSWWESSIISPLTPRFFSYGHFQTERIYSFLLQHLERKDKAQLDLFVGLYYKGESVW